MIDIDFEPLPGQEAFLDSKARIKLAQGGIGSGKSMVGAIEVLGQPKTSRGVVLAPTYPQLIDSTLYDFKKNFGDLITTHRESPTIETKLTNGLEILWWSGDKPQNKRGPNINWAWMDEAHYTKREAFMMLIGRLRLGRRNLWMTSSPIVGGTWVTELFDKQKNNPNYSKHILKTKDNIHNSEGYYEDLVDLYTKDYARAELDGEDVELSGALVKRENFRYYDVAPEGTQWAIGVDPASSVKTSADHTAILVVGVHPDTGNVYIQEFVNRRMEFHENGIAIGNMYEKCISARRIPNIINIEEVAFSAWMKQELLRTTKLPVRGVKPEGDKVQRYMPLMVRYEQGKVFHQNSLPKEYEEQVLSFTGQSGNADDMVDATVYAYMGASKRQASGVTWA